MELTFEDFKNRAKAYFAFSIRVPPIEPLLSRRKTNSPFLEYKSKS